MPLNDSTGQINRAVGGRFNSIFNECPTFKANYPSA
jgi:hypothetical protein